MEQIPPLVDRHRALGHAERWRQEPHTVYTVEEATAAGIVPKRISDPTLHARDWLLTDDGYVIQIHSGWRRVTVETAVGLISATRDMNRPGARITPIKIRRKLERTQHEVVNGERLPPFRKSQWWLVRREIVQAYLADDHLSWERAFVAVTGQQIRPKVLKYFRDSHHIGTMIQEEITTTLQTHQKGVEYFFELMDTAVSLSKENKDPKTLLHIAVEYGKMHGLIRPVPAMALQQNTVLSMPNARRELAAINRPMPTAIVQDVTPVNGEAP